MSAHHQPATAFTISPNRMAAASAPSTTAMLTAAGFTDIEHERGDDSHHAIHLFVARLAGSRAAAVRDDGTDTSGATSV